MTTIVPKCVVFIAASLCLYGGLGCALTIDINPSTVNGLVHNDVSISCGLDSNDSSVTELLFIDISRNETAVVTARKDYAEVIIAHGMKDKFQAEGRVNRGSYGSYLKATLLNPRLEDAGSYECILYYVGDSGLVKERRATGSLTVSNSDTTAALIYLGNQVASLKKELRDEKKNSGGLQDKILSLTNKVEFLRENLKENSTVMFAATHTSSEALHEGTTLVFNEVITNIGQAFNGQTGVFNAPVAGYYLFQIYVTATENSRFFVDITKDDERIATILAGDSHWFDYSGGSCVVKLEVGDEVKPVVRNPYNTPHMYRYSSGYPVNRFSGFLLKSL